MMMDLAGLMNTAGRKNACGSKTLSANLTKKDGTEGENMKGNYSIISHINLEKTSWLCWQNILYTDI